MDDLSTKTARRELKVRRDPYWHRLREGQYLGFRRGPDTWICRFRNRDKTYSFHALDENYDRIDDARKEAETWFASMAGAVTKTPKRSTVKAALRAYLQHLREHGRGATADDAEGKFETTVFKDKLAILELENASRDDFIAWRKRLAKDGGRESRSINRYVRQVAAGLNLAVSELGHVGSPKTWTLTPLQDDVEQSDKSETAIFLSADQRKRLIAAASPAAAEYFKGLEATGARPSELANAHVKDYTDGRVRLASRKSKGGKLRIRDTELLTSEEREFFTRHTDGRQLDECLLLDADGEQWRRHAWAREMRAAIVKYNEAGLDQLPTDKDLGAYVFRHARISEMLQIHGIDPVTVAIQCGTSVVMIEKAYHKFIPSAMRTKLEKARGAPEAAKGS
jgi:integrase